jgi:hypothetical protein
MANAQAFAGAVSTGRSSLHKKLGFADTVSLPNIQHAQDARKPNGNGKPKLAAAAEIVAAAIHTVEKARVAKKKARGKVSFRRQPSEAAVSSRGVSVAVKLPVVVRSGMRGGGGENAHSLLHPLVKPTDASRLNPRLAAASGFSTSELMFSSQPGFKPQTRRRNAALPALQAAARLFLARRRLAAKRRDRAKGSRLARALQGPVRRKIAARMRERALEALRRHRALRPVQAVARGWLQRRAFKV